jgi:hypothetical protein
MGELADQAAPSPCPSIVGPATNEPLSEHPFPEATPGLPSDTQYHPKGDTSLPRQIECHAKHIGLNKVCL